MKKIIFQIIIILLILPLINNYPVLAENDSPNDIELEELLVNDDINAEDLELNENEPEESVINEELDEDEIATESLEIIITQLDILDIEEEQMILYDHQPVTMEEIQFIIDLYEMLPPEERVKPHWQYAVDDWLMPEGYYCGYEDMDETFPYPYYTFFSYPEINDTIPEIDITFDNTLDEYIIETEDEYSIIESISEMSATVNSAESFLKALEDQVDEITLESDIIITVSISPSAYPPTSRYDIVKDLTIYGQNHTLTLNYTGTGGNYFRLVNSGTLKLFDLTIVSTVSRLYNTRHLFSVYNPSGSSNATWNAEFTNVKFSGSGLIGQQNISGANGTIENVTFYGTTEINVTVDTASYNAIVYAKSVIFEGTTSLYAGFGYYLNSGFIYAANDIVINSDINVVTNGYGVHNGLFYSDSGTIYFNGNVELNIDQPNSTLTPIMIASGVKFYGNQTIIDITRNGGNHSTYEYAVIYATEIELGKPNALNSSDGSTITINVEADLAIFKSPLSSSGALLTNDTSYGNFIVNPYTTVTFDRDNYYYVGLVRHASTKSLIEGYTNHYFKNNCTLIANARTLHDPTTAIITSMRTIDFIIETNAAVTLTSSRVEPVHETGCSTLILKKPDEGCLNFTIENGGSLEVSAFRVVSSVHGYAPIRMLGRESRPNSLSLTTIYGSLTVLADNGTGWWYQYNLGVVSGKDTFIVDGGQVNIIVDGSQGTEDHAYAAFAHYTKNELEIQIINGGYMQVRSNGQRAMSLAGSSPPTANSGVKKINVIGFGSTLELNGAQCAISAEANATLYINVLDGGHFYSNNTLNSNIYTTGKAIYTVSGGGSEFRIIRSGESASGSITSSLYGAIFHENSTYGPLEIYVTHGGYMYVENNYGTRAAICAQSSSARNVITVTGGESNLTVINNNTKDARASSIIVDNALYPLGAIAFSANTSGDIYVEDGGNFYAESHNPFSPTIALGGYGPYYPANTPSGTLYLKNPGYIDIRNDSDTGGDIRATALRGRSYLEAGHSLHSVTTSFHHTFTENTQLTISVENCDITVYRTDGFGRMESYIDWPINTIIRSWKDATFNAGNIQTVYNIFNGDGSNSINGAAAGNTELNSFSLQTYGRITVGGGFRVTYYGNGGETSDYLQHYEVGLYKSGTTHSVMDNNDIGFKMDSSLFMYWNTQPDGSGYSYYPNHTLVITEDVTLYAIWRYIGDNQFVLPLTGGNGVFVFKCLGVMLMGGSILCTILGVRNNRIRNTMSKSKIKN